MGSVFTTDQISAAMDRRVRKHFLDTYPTVKPKLEEVFKIEDQEDETEYEQDYYGLGQYEETGEAETYKSDNFGEGYETTYTPVKYTKRVAITMEAEMWDKSDLSNGDKVGKQMAEAAADTIEERAANTFNNAFSTSYTSYGDSKPLCSTGHTRPDGGSSQSNASASGITLKENTLETGVISFRGQKNKRGRLIKAKPRKLLVPPSLEKEAKILTGSDKRPETADNDTNVYNMSEYYGGSMKVVVWDYIGSSAGGSATHWFLLDPRVHKVTWKWASKPSVREDDTTGRQSDTLWYLGMFYASKGWSDWRGVWGSKGDGNDYSD